jgi:polyribonucleotide nucleotidyltransferase
MKVIQKSFNIGGRTLILEVGRLAHQANAAVLGRLGDTQVLATVCSAKPREDLDYFPLTVDYIERLYAGGRISSSRFIKREGRPTEEAILTGRLIDRSIRPLFPPDFYDETQVIITVLSVDNENDPDILAITTASAALSISDIPWDGPVAGVRVGFINGAYCLNPANGELDNSSIDLVVSTTKDAIVMVEAGMKEVPEETVVGALEFAQKESQIIIDNISQLQDEIGKKKRVYEVKSIEEEERKKLEKEAQESIEEIIQLAADKTAPENPLELILEEVKSKFPDTETTQLRRVVDNLFKERVRKSVLEKRTRVDGRRFDEIRPIEIEISLLTRTHGSAIFKRGETQALTIVTLGSPTLEQTIEGMEGEETKRYMHHYNMPPFSVGEVSRLGSPARREIGHGALAERALLPVIPLEEKFPYTIRVVSEIMSSNGSTSMASVCGSTLALMDAGVPITSMVAGIAMGLMASKGKHEILTDIAGVEDHCGDMDFKVAGTKKGITALQMDIKTTGTERDILEKALEEAKKARLFVLEKMKAVISAPRPQISPYAPKIAVLFVEPAMIGEVIGPGGRTIRKITTDTQAAIDIEDDGRVTISADNAGAIDAAIKLIEGLTRQVQPGEKYEGTVTRIVPFGAFVAVLPGKEGLVHLSRMSSHFVSKPEEVVSIGKRVTVWVKEIDQQGRINLSMIPPEEENQLKTQGTFQKQGNFRNQYKPHDRFHKSRY